MPPTKWPGGSKYLAVAVWAPVGWLVPQAASRVSTFEYFSHHHLGLKGVNCLSVCGWTHLVLSESTHPWKGPVGYIGSGNGQEEKTRYHWFSFMTVCLNGSLVTFSLSPLPYLLCPADILSTLSVNLESTVLTQESVWCQLSIVETMEKISCHYWASTLISNLQKQIYELDTIFILQMWKLRPKAIWLISHGSRLEPRPSLSTAQ